MGRILYIKIKKLLIKRTAVLFIIFSFLFSDSLLNNSISVYAKEDTLSDNDLYALSACLMDGESGRILYEKAGDEVRANASTTKIFTCILALEYGDLNDTVVVSSYAAKMPDVQLNIVEGEEYRLEDLLYSLMLESHNDSAVAVAEHIAGSVENFSDLMNEKAKEIGCTNTHFITPNGLDAEDEAGIHGTTAEDLALILRYCITISSKKDAFLKITRTASYSFSNLSGTRTFLCTNHNSFLNMMDGALTGKTGFTGNAGYCYVGAVERDGHLFIVALLACGWPSNKTYKWSDTKKLVNYGIDNYSELNISDEMLDEISVLVTGSDESSKIYISNEGDEEPIDEASVIYLSLASDFSYSLLLRENEEIRLEYVLPEKITAPVKEGSQIGSVMIYIDDKLFDIEPLYCSEEIKEVTYQNNLEVVIKSFFML